MALRLEGLSVTKPNGLKVGDSCSLLLLPSFSVAFARVIVTFLLIAL
uniref:Haloalkane dehalogenase isoform X2 n=1 Tax=Rhizophora mucronata TaxID=61149 RepID=A0A2P2LNL1_RHIMU